MELTSVQLRPDWALLDSTFESYKLSLQQLPIYPLELQCKVDSVKVADDDFSYNRTMALSLHNYLFGDPWCEKDCYFVDSTGHVRRVTVVVETAIQPPSSVFRLDPHFLRSERHTPVTLSFPSPSLCLISDGAGLMYLLSTGDRQNKPQKWEAIPTEEIAGNSSSPPMLLHSRYYTVPVPDESGDGVEENKEVIDVLMLRYEDEKNEGSTVTMALVEWAKLSKAGKTAKYAVESHRYFKAKQAPFHAAFGDGMNELYLGAHTLISFVPDWNQQLLIDEMEIDTTDAANGNMDGDEENSAPSYEWQQTSENVTAHFTLPASTMKDQILYNLTKNTLNIGIKAPRGDTSTLLSGKLFAEADPEASDWVITDGKLDVTVQKEVQGQIWPCVVLGDTSGKRLIGEENTSASAAELQEMDTRDEQPIGLEQYEDCDDLPDFESKLYRFDSTVNKFTHEASVASNQRLFNCLHYGKLCTVLRHDVDALIWEAKTPTEADPEPWKHVATFNALGYVRASKEDVKFCGSSPTASYAALCESTRRIFVYHCPTSSKTPLRNRTTGRDVHISKQQVVTLPSVDAVIGFHATTEHMFVLTESKLFIVKVATPET